jgi:UDP-N-acetylglucosamine--N-acetylmuramyl-(pentapeptide) pyrophosphoryl-undecaprenol N-acetylglucosamine transferase
VNRILAKLADKVLLGFPDAVMTNRQTLFSGNPVRSEIAQLEAPEKRYAARSGNLRLLVIGGSLGAQVLNTTVPLALKLIPESRRPLVTHQAGTRHLEVLKKNYAQANVEGELVTFIDNMAARYAECDLVVCRAGALTVAAAGAAVMLPQGELTAEGLAELLTGFTREKLADMAGKARQLAKPDATRIVAEACMEMITT